MFKDTPAFSGFSVDDADQAKQFYGETLGIEVEDAEMGGMLLLHLGGGGPPTIVYPKPNHEPATFTILNFPVADVEATVDALVAKGVTFEQYGSQEMPQDAKGIMRGHGPDIAWFKDPAGNVLSILSEG